MKKALLVLVLMCIATFAFAQINLGDFPAGRWLDANYDAIWELSPTNIRILDSKTGEVHYSFAGNIQNFRIGASGANPAIQFSCPDASNRSYTISTRVPSADLTLVIDRPNLPQYEVRLTKQ